MQSTTALSLIVGWAVAVPGAARAAAGEKAAHPFLLWTKDEAAAIRKRIDTDPSAKRQYERMVEMEKGGKGTNKALLNLFRYSALGDAAAGEAEKKALLRFIGARPPANRPGNPASGNARWRDDRTLDALRFDILYDSLTDEQRKGVLDTIRGYVEWFRVNPGSHGSRGGRPRTGWLPNMQWPTMAGIHVLAAAGGDEGLIRQVFETPRGWKWFFDVYLADGRFYMEEFGKYYSNIGSMILWCQGLRRLGLDRYGWGYAAPNGACMRNFLEMLIWAGYPRVERPGGTPDYPTVNMGDAGPLSLVDGQSPPDAAQSRRRPANARGTPTRCIALGTPWWRQAMMNGPIPKMMQPLWWEAGHKNFPDAGFDYFLAQMRGPGEAVYLPTLYFGLGPIDPKKVKPPSAGSYVAPGRGFALLRAEESPAYWESPAPAVALQFAMYYVHYVHDCFSILQYVAHNRFIYNKMGAAGRGYAGGDPWRDHVRGQGSGVVVDGLKARYVDSGEEGIRNERLRHHFCPPAKFVAIQARGVYPDVEQERALVLTREYLLDVFRLKSDRPRVYDWHVLSPASVAKDKSAGWRPGDIAGGKVRGRQIAKPLLTDVRYCDVADRPWRVTLIQGDANDDTGVGVHVSMLGGTDTILVAGRPPSVPAEAPAVKLLATRTHPATVFAALHHPFAGPVDRPMVQRFEQIAAEEAGLAVAVVGRGRGINDRIVVRAGSAFDKAATLAGGGESFTVADYAFVRVGADKVEAFGGLSAMKVKVTGEPKLLVNGKVAAAKVAGGVLEYSAAGRRDASGAADGK